MRRFTVSCLVLLFALAPRADASKVKTWRQQSASNYEKAKFQQTVLSSEGALRLAKAIAPYSNLKADHAWDVVEDKAGNLFVATGDDGKVFKVGADGKATVVIEDKEGPFFSVLALPDGSVLAAGGPKGKLWKIQPDGSKKVIADKLGKYVWSLAYDAGKNRVLAGTGPDGQIYQIDPTGKATEFFKAKQAHVLAVTVGPDGTVYAGADKGGVVYRISPAGKAFVLFHAHQTEVRSLLATADGLFAGTSVPVPKKSGGSTSSSTKTDDFRSGPAPGSGDNSIYRIAPDGSVRELIREKILMLRMLGDGDKILVGTGMQGQLLEIDPATKERTELARVEHGQIHSLIRRKDGSLLVSTGDVGKLYSVSAKLASKGTMLSEVLDAKLPSRWGAFTWTAKTPAGTTASVAVRSGNVADPDDTWSDWSAEQTDPEDSRAQAPTARYLQYRVTLTSNDPKVSPEFKGLALRYQTLNQAPEITNVETPDGDAAPNDNSKKVKIRWTASDPNDDDLTYAVYVQRDGWKEWVLLEENIERKDFEWDVTGMPSGPYRVKVVASDRKDNAQADVLSSERIGGPMIVAHAAPAVTLKVASVVGGVATLEASATDPLVRLVEASFAVNGKRWTNVFPVDGLFDSKAEQFRFTTERLRPGAYVVVLRVKDSAGNTGSADAVFSVPAAK